MNLLFQCEICGAIADIHHIIHKSKGGYDFSLNYKYLCEYHHRGKLGPHYNSFTDLKYKLELQDKLYAIMPKKYYFSKELYSILNLPSCSFKRLTKKLKLYKEGYKTDDIIAELMGGKLYHHSMLEELELNELFNSISIG